MTTGSQEQMAFILPGGADISPEEQLELVQHAERLGYDSVWVGETWGVEAFTTLAWLASHTTTIKLGTGIINVFSRTPSLMAQSVATLDHIAGGRVLLGLGTSGLAVIENWHGVPFQQGTQRLKECAQIVRQALSGERVDFQGEIFKLQGFRLNAKKPLAAVPIYFASITPAGVRAAGESADGWIPIWTSAEGITQGLREIKAAAKAVGRVLKDFQVVAYLHTAVSTDPHMRELARAQLAFYIGNMGVYYHQHISRQGFGVESDAIQAAFAQRERERAANLITDDMLEHLMVLGDAQHCRARLDQYRQAGAALPLLSLIGSPTAQQCGDTLEALAPRNGQE